MISNITACRPWRNFFDREQEVKRTWIPAGD